MRAHGGEESLEIPKDVREAVDARDNYFCRVCGKYLGPERRALHHIIYGGDAQGMGGRRKHDPDTIVTVCWLPGDNNCHLIVHGAKHKFQPILLVVAQQKGVTALQQLRWNRSASRVV